MREKDVFSAACLSQPALVSRLIESFREAMREFANNPRQYMALMVKGEGPGGALRVDRLRFGLALGLALYVILIGASFLLWSFKKAGPHSLADVVVVKWLRSPGRPVPAPESPISDQNSGGGGGGGGRLAEIRPATGGALPQFSNEKPVIAPTTRIQLVPPSLPIAEILQIDPRLQPVREEIAPTGLPSGPSGPSSDGPGSEGIGSGNRGGVGSGEGPGSGPGKNGIGGGPGGSPGKPRSGASPQLTSKPVALNRPRPNYTEEARIQRVQGVIKASVLVGSDGIVKLVRLQNGLPAGLDEEAIRAAYEMRFRPGVSSGRPIETWVTLEIEFNLR
jgi:TonB family protein